jgi:serine/threonine protein kinase
MELDLDNPTSNFLIHSPDFSQLGYELIKELGRNRIEGRITYLAKVCKSDQQVVIKQFNFAHTSADWSGLKTYEREIAILQQLDHPRIPRYIDSFATPDHFYLVEEYKNAPSLGLRRSFQPEEVKQIALSILEILVYLQKRPNPIIHRDIKPENILVDDDLNAYLVDFDLAWLQEAKMALTSIACGTPGFMPPEEQLGHPLTQATDLYSLGVTLMCLLTGTPSIDISQLMDQQYRFNYQQLPPQLHPQFKSWLMKLMKLKGKYRYANAYQALKALEKIPVTYAAHNINTLPRSIKLRQKTAVLCLTITGMLAVATTTFILSHNTEVTQPLTTD